jgi:Xaa-Pro aminopeptidase
MIATRLATISQLDKRAAHFGQSRALYFILLVFIGLFSSRSSLFSSRSRTLAPTMTATKTAAEQSAYTASLVVAEAKALAMFADIDPLVRPGITEKALSDAIHELGREKHGVQTHWHKRLVRSGPNTLRPFEDNPPDRLIGSDDILVVDLGPVFEKWEADFGRTYVLGNDVNKIKLRDALEPCWDQVKAAYDQRPGMTGEELYDIAVAAAAARGFDFGAPIAGHIVGSFPHERIPQDRISLYIAKGSDLPMDRVGKNGYRRHWILEIHLRDSKNNIQGFREQLLTVG